ncbi:hypothetical protein H6G81_05020 [Scytonema hofmannii FACHB-248]|uniref:Uncharacterized protein n=1 Tax=Scytonema hofmannii FACHB-248 TaxID=1842502 RepID=A0ABR8GL83_9CYAN|nr:MULTISPECIES: hypothetical protein [Nostocales]MBD2603910.1 hypothetical protein [Scytonema hofmannii FACHB-248]
MAVPTEIRKRAIALLEQLPGESLVKAVEFLEALSHEALQVSEASKPEVSEAALLQIIQHRLSDEEQDRLTYLRQQNEIGVITDTEHQELLIYVDRVEQQDAQRAEALIKLAQIRDCDLKILINEFLPTHSNVG